MLKENNFTIKSQQASPLSKKWKKLEKRLWELNLNQLRKIHQFFQIKFCGVQEKELKKEDYVLVLKHDADYNQLEKMVDKFLKLKRFKTR